MAKTDNNTPFGDFMKKVKLSSDRKHMKPRPTGIGDDEYLMMSIKEGYALLEAEGTGSVKTSLNLRPSKHVSENSQKLQDTLAKMSTNPYVRARGEILNKMSPAARSVIEKMENGQLDKDGRYDTFCKAVSQLGEKYYLSN